MGTNATHGGVADGGDGPTYVYDPGTGNVFDGDRRLVFATGGPPAQVGLPAVTRSRVEDANGDPVYSYESAGLEGNLARATYYLTDPRTDERLVEYRVPGGIDAYTTHELLLRDPRSGQRRVVVRSRESGRALIRWAHLLGPPIPCSYDVEVAAGDLVGEVELESGLIKPGGATVRFTAETPVEEQVVLGLPVLVATYRSSTPKGMFSAFPSSALAHLRHFL